MKTIVMFFILTTLTTTLSAQCTATLGDLNGNSLLTVADISVLETYLRDTCQAPNCLANGDFNSDGAIDGCDAQDLTVFLFSVTPVNGDLNRDGTVDISDFTILSQYILGGVTPPLSACLNNGDVNCDGNVDLADVIYLNNYLFNGGPAPC